ncbi:CDP-ribitol ribitolphosphotransferase [Amphibacillus marinus]|uniref:CDP-ribitol ribitolphosphotransferase n=1 Tax=Amphibacillus marinus TaxID=872970 RepID=A0A1H8N4X6_9BACI|nr:CDP-glycerol glycerophosphotransferase family protein [Amphibacillus marinus]SEO24528.1 CDP-ribitol ribitolphosphotransferase [Amphibacillus marinus]
MSIKLIFTIVSNFFIRIVYNLSSLFPVVENRVVFASSRSDSLSGNLYYVFNELESRTETFECIFLLEKFKSGFFNKVFYFLRMLKATFFLATSEFFFIDDYYYPIYVIKPRNKVKIIQLWHATGAFKKFGYSTIGKSFGPSEKYLNSVKIHSNYSYVTVSTKHIISYYAEAFDMPENKIVSIGIPRIDFFFNSQEHEELKKRFFKEYSNFKNKKIILYAPTYRGGSYRKKSFESKIDFYQLKKNLGTEYIFLVHLHPYITEGLAEDFPDDFVYEITERFNVNELMIISDILITDYSSVIFEFSLLHKPIVFYTPDLNSYKKERDFYYNFETFIPGPKFDDTEAMSAYIKKDNFDLEKIKKFSDYFFERKDNLNSKRVVDYFIGKGTNKISRSGFTDD